MSEVLYIFVVQFVVMIPGMDPKKLEQTLKQLGMQMENIQASLVTIKTNSGDIIIDKPQVIKTTMRGQIVYQISGETKEESVSADDIKLVKDQTGIKDEKKIRKALEETKGDVVEAIMKLKS
jgi:nascent polypeptide-associated complex subunit alpha